MATMGNVPHLIGDMMTTRSWHKPYHKPLKLTFYPRKGASKLKNTPDFKHKSLYINHLAWFDPKLAPNSADNTFMNSTLIMLWLNTMHAYLSHRSRKILIFKSNLIDFFDRKYQCQHTFFCNHICYR